MNFFLRRETAIDLPPSPSAIAAQVEMTSAHRRAEETLRALRAERTALTDREATLRLALGDNQPVGVRAELRSTTRHREEIEGKIRDLRVEIVPMRNAHAERVRAALATPRQEAAAALLQALAALREAAEMLSACHEAERRHFGDPAIISLPDLGHIELLARRAAGKSAPPAAAQPFGVEAPAARGDDLAAGSITETKAAE